MQSHDKSLVSDVRSRENRMKATTHCNWHESGMKQDLEEEMKKNIRTTREIKRRERTASISHGRQTTHTTKKRLGNKEKLC